MKFSAAYKARLIGRLFTRFALSGSCLLWTGALDTNGYGSIFVRGKTRRVHAVMYVLLRGPLPKGLEPDHLCRRRACGNPYHVEYVTHQVNMIRSDNANRKKTHCKNGHPYSKVNTYIHGNRRTCRICAAAALRRHRAAK